MQEGGPSSADSENDPLVGAVPPCPPCWELKNKAGDGDLTKQRKIFFPTKTHELYHIHY